MDQIPHLAKVRIAVSNPVFRSIVAGQTRFFILNTRGFLVVLA
jgi:hypothetical protein